MSFAAVPKDYVDGKLFIWLVSVTYLACPALNGWIIQSMGGGGRGGGGGYATLSVHSTLQVLHCAIPFTIHPQTLPTVQRV